MESIRDAVIAERWSRSRSVSEIHQGAFKLSVIPPALTASVDVRNDPRVQSTGASWEVTGVLG